MPPKVRIQGREALMSRLDGLVPDVEKYAAPAKLEAVRELAEAVRMQAPTGATLDYMESIDGDFISDRPGNAQVGIQASKDKNAAGLFAKFTWAWLEFGTAAHSTAKGGGTVAGKKAAAESSSGVHPGTAAQPHIFPTYRAMRPRIRRKIAAAINKAVREAMKK